jgi:hypothetical protein
MDEATRNNNRRYYLADRSLADGGCEMEELGEPLRDECYSEATTIRARKKLGKRDF